MNEYKLISLLNVTTYPTQNIQAFVPIVKELKEMFKKEVNKLSSIDYGFLKAIGKSNEEIMYESVKSNEDLLSELIEQFNRLDDDSFLRLFFVSTKFKGIFEILGTVEIMFSRFRRCIQENPSLFSSLQNSDELII